MSRSSRFLLAGSVAALCGVAIAVPGLSQGGSRQPARYSVDAGTMSGMGAMGSGGGIGAAMSALTGGGGGQLAHELHLKLGSSQAATGDPRADHFMPAGVGLGTVPLVTPRRTPTGTPEMPLGQMSKGRLLLFWGCGERAPAGQPAVIDFSRLARGEVPSDLYAQPLNLAEQWRIDWQNSTTYGEWPNERTDRQVPATASLLGSHRIASSYAPDIAFTLADDFMPGLRASSSDRPGGSVSLGWNALPTATGYYAWAMATGTEGPGAGRDMVWWSSAATQQFGGPMWDWLSPPAVRRLIEARTVMPPSQTECTIPAEVRETGGPMLMTNLFAYGPQADFSHPARPANAPRDWNPDWIARVRFRSNTTLIHGMPGFDAMEAGEVEAGQTPSARPAKPRCPRGLRGVAERAAGLCE